MARNNYGCYRRGPGTTDRPNIFTYLLRPCRWPRRFEWRTNGVRFESVGSDGRTVSSRGFNVRTTHLSDDKRHVCSAISYAALVVGRVSPTHNHITVGESFVVDTCRQNERPKRARAVIGTVSLRAYKNRSVLYYYSGVYAVTRRDQVAAAAVRSFESLRTAVFGRCTRVRRRSFHRFARSSETRFASCRARDARNENGKNRRR